MLNGIQPKITEEKDSIFLHRPLTPELEQQIFYFLPLRNLVNTQLVCSSWNNLINAAHFWQQKIMSDFPHLKDTKETEFFENPHALYRDHCQILKDEVHRLCLNYTNTNLSFTASAPNLINMELMTALKGDLKKIDENTLLNESMRQVLYSIAVASGHYEALNKADYFSSLRIAIATTNLPVIQHLVEKKITHHDNVIDIDARVLRSSHMAARLGALNIVQYFLQMAEKTDSSDSNRDYLISYKQRLFRSAAQCGQLEVVQYLFQKVPDSRDLYQSLNSAATEGHLNIVQYIMEATTIQSNNSISDIDKGEVLICAAKAGKLEVVKFVWENAPNIPENIKSNALIYAAKKGRSTVVDFLLTERNFALDDLKEAKAAAESCAFSSIADSISRKFSETNSNRCNM